MTIQPENPYEKLRSVEAEQSIIGGVLMDNTAAAKCGGITPEMFTSFPYRQAWGVIIRLLAKGGPADILTVGDVLRNETGQDDFDVLADAVQNTPSTANIAAYVDIVKERYLERRLLEASCSIAKLATERDEGRLAERQAKAIRILSAVADEAAGGVERVSYAQALIQSLENKDKVMQLPEGALQGLPTGLKALNAATGGLRRGWLSVIAGRPSMGKSVLAENIARCCAKRGFAVHFQSYEMTTDELTDRGCAAEKSVDYSAMQNCRFTCEQLGLYNDYITDAHDWRMTIDTEMLDADQICARARADKLGGGLDLLVIDHLHLMPRPGKNTVQELDAITARFKQLAMELDIHVLLVAQLNRGREKEQEKRPTMSDIRDSGGIEQNANLIILPYRESYYDETANPTTAELIIAKNRNGRRGTLHIGWSGQYQRFENEADPFAVPEKMPEGGEDYAC